MALPRPMYVKALDIISHGQHTEVHGDLFSNCEPDNHSAAQQIYSSITTFEFIVVLLLANQFLFHLTGRARPVPYAMCSKVEELDE